jgi:hypothetical protein
VYKGTGKYDGNPKEKIIERDPRMRNVLKVNKDAKTAIINVL